MKETCKSFIFYIDQNVGITYVGCELYIYIYILQNFPTKHFNNAFIKMSSKIV